MEPVPVLVGVFLLFLLAILLFRTAIFSSREKPVLPVELVEVPPASVGQHLSRAITFKTVSNISPQFAEGGAGAAAQAFNGFVRALQEMYPRLHRNLQLDVVSQFSRLYTWQGSDPTLQPLLLLAHLDVVPAEPGSEGAWTHPPFSGQIDGGFVWGRGAMDMKNSVIGILEAVEVLLQAGYSPRRTVLIALGHDEELGGYNGARQIAALLEKRGIQVECILDEGGPVSQGLVPGIRRPVALVGVAEKGHVALDLTVESGGGHAAMPPAQTAIGILSQALSRLETHPMRPQTRFIGRLLARVGGELPLGMRLVVANRWLFGGLLTRQMGKSNRTNAMIRTTLATTLIGGGIHVGVLPQQARAIVDCRILPGETIDGVLSHVRRVIADRRVRVEPLRFDPSSLAGAGSGARRGPGKASPARSIQMAGDGGQSLTSSGWEPSAVSDDRSPAYALLERTIRQVYAQALVAPFLMMAATDSRHYAGLSQTVFRFSPMQMDPEDLARLHGVNERLSLEDCSRMVQFYAQWIRNHDHDSFS